ncbi:uncharacterized protein LOC133723250 [Rosa rugosa]|uniref:uncharacterized protein LOC133723250 n=1 Tax=Rosa rugosa TaxID=74645 RepID=UPI002B417E6D|nr:uncharacterized protein LOC133723250 [Rosa rugosa]
MDLKELSDAYMRGDFDSSSDEENEDQRIREDCRGQPGFTPHQKVTAAMRMLAYGNAADALDEYLRMGESTARECLKKFCDIVMCIYEAEFLRKPTQEDIDRLLRKGESRGFPGMLGSLDCMHWE